MSQSSMILRLPIAVFATGASASIDRPAPTDDALVGRALGGDQRAFELLVDRHRAKVSRIAARMMRSRSDAEDVVQDALLDCYRGLASFSGNAAFSTWLCQIAVNAALMNHRAARCRPGLHVEGARGSELNGCDDPPSGDDLPPAEDRLDRMRLLRMVERALTPLDERSRTVFAMRVVEGVGTQEVANSLKISPMAVRQRLHRARASIRRYVAPLLESG